MAELRKNAGYPQDKIYGIGIDKKTAMEKGKAGWQGDNLLGELLTLLRNK